MDVKVAHFFYEGDCILDEVFSVIGSVHDGEIVVPCGTRDADFLALYRSLSMS